MTDTPSFSNQRVLITGGASGLGRALALEAAKRGARHIELWDLSKEGLAEAAGAIPSGASVSTQVVDVSDPARVTKAANATLKSHGVMDIVINSAGVVSGKHFAEVTPEDLDRTFRVNVFSLYWVTQAFLPAMRAQNHGRIVTIASAAGLIGPARQTDYSASKHAAVGFMESLRSELRQEKSPVTTLTICPFYVKTGMFEGVESRNPLLPLLEVSEAVTRMADAIESSRVELLLPRMVGAVRLARLLPARWVDQVADLFGINHTMDHFTGRAKKTR